MKIDRNCFITCLSFTQKIMSFTFGLSLVSFIACILESNALTQLRSNKLGGETSVSYRSHGNHQLLPTSVPGKTMYFFPQACKSSLNINNNQQLKVFFCNVLPIIASNPSALLFGSATQPTQAQWFRLWCLQFASKRLLDLAHFLKEIFD